jgi:hypothetical protein
MVPERPTKELKRPEGAEIRSVQGCEIVISPAGTNTTDTRRTNDLKHPPKGD